jgi:hypothetical protein
MKRSTILRTTAVGATCALVGGAAGIAAGSASTPRPSKDAERHAWLKFGDRRAWRKLGGEMPIPLAADAGPPVHSESVVPDEKGGFATITMDRGTFSSLSGQKLTVAEGTKTATYKIVTLTIPTNATVRRNGETAQLSGIKPGDTVAVVQSPKGTFVDAFDAQHEPKLSVKIAPGRGLGKDEGPGVQKTAPVPELPEPPGKEGPPPS